MCTYEEGSIYKLLKADTLIERVDFDRLPTGLDTENLPNLETLGIQSKMFDSKAACEHIHGNKAPVAVYLAADKPVICVSTFFFCFVCHL